MTKKLTDEEKKARAIKRHSNPAKKVRTYHYKVEQSAKHGSLPGMSKAFHPKLAKPQGLSPLAQFYVDNPDLGITDGIRRFQETHAHAFTQLASLTLPTGNVRKLMTCAECAFVKVTH